MASKKEKVIARIQKITEELQEAGWDNPIAMLDIRLQFEKLTADLPGAVSDILKLLRLCVDGVSKLCVHEAAHPEGIMKGLMASLGAVDAWLAESPDYPRLTREAGQLLDHMLNAEVPRSEEEGSDPDYTEKYAGASSPAASKTVLDSPEAAGTGNESGGSALYPEEMLQTINELTSCLLQIGPDDLDELMRLYQNLLAVTQGDGCPDACLQPLSTAIKLAEAAITAMQSGEVDGISEAVIEQIGNLLNEAAGEADPDISVPFPAPRTPSGPTPPPAGIPADAAPIADGDAASQPAAPDTHDYMPEDADLELISEFINESSDLITNAEEALLTLESNPEDMDAVSTVFRAFHNIKGTSAFFELKLMTELAHHAESVLSRVRDQEIRYAGGYPDLALRSTDMLKELFRLLQDALGDKPFLKPGGYDELVFLLKDPAAAGVTDKDADVPDVPADPPAVPETETVKQAAAPVIRPEPEAAPPLAAAPPRPASDPKKPASAPQMTVEPRKESKAIVETSIRVPIKRLDRFIDTVGELVVSHSMVVQDEVISKGQHHELMKKVSHTSKIVRELQNMSMSMRMIPLKMTFQLLQRRSRDLSKELNKEVRFSSEGEDTEIDRNMVDKIKDPLVHIVRNAIDHGIEYPDDREAIGKPRQGTLHLSAFHDAGNVVVEIKDDGKGLNRETLIAKALERGVITDGKGLSDREAFELIFEPGFSTAEKISAVSGRGVGMDVVKRNIEDLNGHVEILSARGKGSTFRLSLPLTLAIIDGMVVQVGAERYIIPTISIIRSVQPVADDLTSVMKRGEMFNLQGNLIPIFRIAELFDVPNAKSDVTQAIVVVVENDGRQAGLMVDDLIGSQQIVIKTLGEILGNIMGIQGSAIMPDGRVGLILDVGGLVRLANQE